MKTLVIVACVVIAGGGSALFLLSGSVSGRDGSVPDNSLYTVQRGKLTVTLTENGSLMAKNSEKITFSARRGGKITFLIDEGKTVEQDELLCKLDTTELEQQVQQLESQIITTDANLNSAQTELDIQKSENVATIEKAKIAVDKGKNELEKYRDGDAPKERRNLEVSIKEAETEHSRGKKKYEDSLVLFEQTYVNKSQVDQDQIAFERAAIRLEGARKDLELFEQYTRPMTMTDKQTAFSDATRALENAEKRAAATLRQKEVAVQSTQSQLDALKKNLADLKEEIEKFTIQAPSPGIVIYGEPDRYWQRDEIKLGGQIWGGFTLFTIPDLRVMQVQVEIHEADINKLKLEQSATVTMDTYPGLVLTGKVAKIATIAGGQNRRRRNDEVKKFTVDIVLDSTKDETLKPGISAKAGIFIDEREGVLSVPLQCVFIEDGTHYCYVLADEKPARVAVKPGLTNDSFIEIVEGVREGDRVLLYNPALGDTATAAAPEPSNGEAAAAEPPAGE